MAKTVYSADQRAAWMRDWRKRNPDKEKATQRRAFLKWRYDMTTEEYSVMVVAQDGRCAICNKVAELFVDHNHNTNEVRKLLCNTCNLGVGCFYDNPILMRAAATYLENR